MYTLIHEVVIAQLAGRTLSKREVLGSNPTVCN